MSTALQGKDAAVAEKRPAPEKPSSKARSRGLSAEEMATRQRDISVSEFFAKNRHLLGFDNPRKALLTTVKEAVDNALDACEEAGILPDITVVIEDLQPDRPATAKSSRYRVSVVDNGPGIVRKQVENIFGRLLYGSKFHRLKMSRGQQGIGISAAGMYGLITTGKPMVIHTKPGAKQPAHLIELAMNTKTNRAEVTQDEETGDFPPRRLREVTAGTKALSAEKGGFLDPDAHRSGTSVSIELEGRYQRGRGSVDEFLELTAIANPHARIVFVPPSRESADEDSDAPILAASEATAAAAATVTTATQGVTIFPRAVQELPPETREIQPHPKGIELGTLLQMMKDYEATDRGTLYQFMQDRFCRVSAATAGKLCEAIGVTSRRKISDIEPPLAERLFEQFQEAKLAPPPTDCLAPIGVRQLLAGMLKGVRAEFYAASTRDPEVYRGRPFQIEAAIAFGGELPTEEQARVIRFANRVPLLFQQSACSSFKAVIETAWRNYSLQQPRGGLPVGPLVIMIHVASVWVPFTSESKEAIADYDEIRKEMRLALMECGRKLGTYLRKRHRMRREGERRDIFERYIGEVAKALNSINGVDPRKVHDALLAQARARTAVADQVLDEDGKVVKDEPMDEEGVIIVPGAAALSGIADGDGSQDGAAAASVRPGADAAGGAAAPRRRSTKPPVPSRSPSPAAGAKPAKGASARPAALKQASPTQAPPKSAPRGRGGASEPGLFT